MKLSSATKFLLIALISVVSGSHIRDPVSDRLNALAFIKQIGLSIDELEEWFKAAVETNVRDYEYSAEFLTCQICRPALLISRAFINLGGDEEVLIKAISGLCEFLELAPVDSTQQADVCELTIRSYLVPLVYMVRNKPEMTNDDFCGLINSPCGEIKATSTSWETPIADGKPEAISYTKVPDGAGTTKIIQLTDIHLDDEYVVGSIGNCPTPQDPANPCYPCLGDVVNPEDPNYPENPEDIAGPYGHYKCQLPVTGLEEMLRHIKEQHPDAKYIFLTGDYIQSRVWGYSEKLNSRVINLAMHTIQKAFPNTTIIPLSGNHETPIVNMYPPLSAKKDFPLEWMYRAIADPFKQYMGGPGQYGSFLRNGYYTVSPAPGLRLVILNTNICYIQNFWLPYQPIDPGSQLEWFSEVMQEAENANQAVYILGHIPPGNEVCWPYWSDQFDKIVQRYQNLIRFQLYGHTHREYYIVTMDRENDTRAIGMTFVGPSATPDHRATGYKVYYVDGERGSDSTWKLMDHETWLYHPKNNKTAEWYRSYRANEYYNMDFQSPQQYFELTHGMIENMTLMEKFQRVAHKMNPDFKPCDTKQCRIDSVCNTVVHNSADRRICEQLIPKIEDEINGVDQHHPDRSNVGIHLASITSIIVLLLMSQILS